MHIGVIVSFAVHTCLYLLYPVTKKPFTAFYCIAPPQGAVSTMIILGQGETWNVVYKNMLILLHSNNTVTHSPVSVEGYVMMRFILCLYDKYHDKCFLPTILFTIF